MRTLLTGLDFNRYTPRTYVYCPDDEMSLRAITDLETSKGSSVDVDAGVARDADSLVILLRSTSPRTPGRPADVIYHTDRRYHPLRWALPVLLASLSGPTTNPLGGRLACERAGNMCVGRGGVLDAQGEFRCLTTGPASAFLVRVRVLRRSRGANETSC
jgi:hypothetical protein